MSTLLCLKRKIGGSRGKLRTDKRLRYQITERGWQVAKFHARINFELLTDIDMVMFIERGICSGLSQCSNRYTRANKYMLSYDPSKSSSYLMYFDTNNLYSWAMCQPLPYADFRWIDYISNFNVIISRWISRKATFSRWSIRNIFTTHTLTSRSVRRATNRQAAGQTLCKSIR